MPYTSPKASLSPAPSAVRWQMVGLLMGHAAICHFNRISITVAGTEQILSQPHEYGIGETQMGAVYSAYLLAYTLSMMPGGWFIDRRGPHLALALMGFGSAACVVLTGLAGAAAASAGLLLSTFLVVRALTGVSSAPIHPAAARAVSFWVPIASRAWANGLVTGAAVLGIASTFPVFGWLMDRFGWPAAFCIAGAATAAWSLVWTLYATDQPAEHRGVNAQELALIESSEPPTALDDAPADRADPSPRTAAANATHDNTAWEGRPTDPFSTQTAWEGRPTESLSRQLKTAREERRTRPLWSRSLALVTISYGAAGYFQFLFFYWLEYYFAEVLELDTPRSRLYTTIANLAMAAGMILGGWLCDLAQRRLGVRLGRAIVPAAGMVASAVWLALGLMSERTAWVVVCFSLAMAAIGAVEGPFWITAVELGGRRGGLSAAILNTGGNVGGVLSPVVTPLLSKYLGWQSGFSLAGGICLAGAVLWCWITPAARHADDSPRESNA